MKYRNAIVTLGFAVLVLQFLGFPQSWDNALYAALGILVVAFGYLGAKEPKADKSPLPAEAPKANPQP